MKIRFVISMLLLVLGFGRSSAEAQQLWTRSGPTDHIVDIAAANGTTYVLSTSGLYRSTDDHQWSLVRTTVSTESFNSIVALHSGDLFLFSYSSYLTSKDGGATWKKVNNTGFSTRVCVADSLDYLYAGQNDPIQRSTDHGQTWAASQTGTSGVFFDIGVITVAPNGDIYAGNQGITGGLVYRSVDHGLNWTLVHSEAQADVTAIEMHNGSVWIAYTTKLIHSEDGGTTWKTVMSKPSPFVTTILFPNSKKGYVGLASTGLFSTNDTGNSWVGGDGNNGISGRWLSKLFKTTRGNLLAGSDSGLFAQYGFGDVVAKDGPSVNRLLTVFPNPAQNNVEISLDRDPNGSSIEQLEIFDQLGRSVLLTSMSSSHRASGIQSFSVDLSILVAGGYLVVAHTKLGISTTKLVIRK